MFGHCGDLGTKNVCGCQQVCYCNEECQRAHSRTHRVPCEQARKLQAFGAEKLQPAKASSTTSRTTRYNT